MHIVKRILSRRDEAGATAIIVALFFSFIALPLGAVSVDVARLYVELQRVQAAADAAATAGVTFMPDDFGLATARAKEVSALNGFPDSGTSSVVVGLGDKPTQLRVTVSSTVENAFARTFGVDSSTMSRTALADFNGPAPMGSPCNTFGNEPAGSTSSGPTGSVLKTPPPAICTTNPQFWGAIAGPETWKDQGSEFDARKCGGTEVLCASGSKGAKNLEFDPRGFIYLVRVNAAAVGQQVNLQIYDPAYVDTGSACSLEPTANSVVGNNGRYPLATSDAHLRYARGANTFCTGDTDNNGRRFGDETGTTTSFALRAPVDTLNPYAAPAYNPSQCTAQFPGYITQKNADLRNAGSGATYNDALARVFHQWVPLCSFTPDRAGDWYIQVRSTVPIPGGSVPDGTGAVRGNSAVVSDTGDNPAELGNGTNMFSLRAVTSAPAGAVSVASWERMRIFANADSATTTFNLVRVVPAAANKTLVITYFDVGEATGEGVSGTVQVFPPVDSNISVLAGCRGAGVKPGDLPNCEITGITPTKNNGKTQEIRVPIPSTYTCESTSQGGCWFRVRISFPGAKVTDATTWTARILGEPVRLIE